MKTNTAQQIEKKSDEFFAKSEMYEYNGREMVIGSKEFVRHMAAMKAHVTRLDQYIKKVELDKVRHEAAVKAWVTRRAENPKYAKINTLISKMPRGGR